MKTILALSLLFVALSAGLVACAWDAKPACGAGSDHGPCPEPLPTPASNPDGIFSRTAPDAGGDAAAHD
ncbi:MAG: hypothetical protein ACHREM_00475 [Polyangiales bacterium]